MADKQLLVRLMGDSSGLDKAFNKAGKSAGDFGSKLSSLVAGAAIGAFLKDCTNRAMESERSWAILKVAVENTGASFTDFKPEIDGNLASLSKLSAFSKGDLRGALTTLTQMTGNVSQAQELMGLAADVARAKGMGVGEAAQKVGLILAGNTRVLKQFGIQTREGATAMDYLHEIQLKTQGSAEAFGNTYAGKLAKMQNAVNGLKVSIGEQLLPVLGNMADSAVASVDGFNALSPAVRQGTIQVGLYGAAFAVVIKGIASFLGLIPAAVAASATLNVGVQRGIGAWREYVLNVTHTKGAFDSYSRGVLTAVPAMRMFYDMQNGAGASTRLLGTAAEGTTPRMARLQNETRLAASAAIQAADAEDKLTRALDGTMVAASSLEAKQRALREAQMSERQASIDVREAEKALAEAIKTEGKNSDAAKSAQLRLEQAQLRAADSSYDLKAAQEECSAAIAAARSPILGTAGAINQIRANARNAAAALRDMARAGKISGQMSRSASGGGAAFAWGGVARGPSSGYPATLHGTEVVIPTDDRAAGLRWLATAAQMLGADKGGGQSAPAPSLSRMVSGGDTYILNFAPGATNAGEVEAAVRRANALDGRKATYDLRMGTVG